MAKFHSINAGLVLQDDDGVWAQFTDGLHETHDDGVAERLRGVDGITELEADDDAAADDGDDAEPVTPVA